jgi:alkylation response protein AidB-like acyl-CoA dehydrogenase
MADAVVERARALRPLIEQHAAEGERDRRLAAPVVAALRDAGLFRLCVPVAYGGPELAPATLVEVIEAVAAADGAAGWCVMIASTTSSMSVFLPPEHAKAIYGDPDVVTGGVFAPSGTAERADGGHVVTGRWSWGSGTDHCQWITGGTRTPDGGFHLMYFPAADVRLLDDWDAMGLRGTASGDFVVEGAFVPDGRSVQPGVSRPQLESPLAAFPNYNLLAAGVAAALLGLGRRAVEEITALAQGKTPLYSSKTLARSPAAQVEVARAEAELSAARAFLLDELQQAWDVASAGGRVDVDRRARIRLACTHAARSAAAAVDRAYHAGGGSSVHAGSPLQRVFRDVHTGTQHLMISPRIDETVGKLLLGVEADTAML